MVRTRADPVGARISAAKAPRKVLSSSSSCASPSGSSGSSREKYAGGNSYNPQPTPSWQKGIGSFFTKGAPPKHSEADAGQNMENDAGAGPSTSSD